MIFNNKQELIDKIKEKEESAKIAYEQTFNMQPCYETKEKQVKNKAYMEAYADVMALIDSAKIVVYPEETGKAPTTRNDELDALQYAVEGLNKFKQTEAQNLAKKFFGKTIKVHTRRRIVGSTTPFESTGKVVVDSGKFVSIKEEDGRYSTIDKADIESIEIMSAPEYRDTLFADPLKVSDKGCVEENDQKTLFEKEPKQDMKVEIIRSGYYEELENEVNDFIKDKAIIDIKFTAGSDYGSLIYFAMIIYKEDKSE